MGSRTSGKKPRYNAEVHENICKHLRVGAYFKHAAEAADVSVDAAREWVNKGLAGDRRYAAFARDVRRLQAEHAVRLQSIVTRAALKGDWRPASWALARQFPTQYGQGAGAAVTVRSGPDAARSGDGGQGGDNDGIATVSFYLPYNGRRPGEPDPDPDPDPDPES